MKKQQVEKATGDRPGTITRCQRSVCDSDGKSVSSVGPLLLKFELVTAGPLAVDIGSFFKFQGLTGIEG